MIRWLTTFLDVPADRFDAAARFEGADALAATVLGYRGRRWGISGIG